MNNINNGDNVDNVYNVDKNNMAATSTPTPTSNANDISLLKRPVVCVLCVSPLLSMLLVYH